MSKGPKDSTQHDIVAWDEGQPDLQGFYKLNAQSEFSSSRNEWIVLDNTLVNEEIEKENYNKDFVLENLHTVLQFSEGEFGLDFKVDPGLASLDHSEVEGLVLVPIDESKITDNLFVFSNGAAPNLEVGDFPFVDGDRVKLKDMLQEPDENINFVADAPIAPPTPILAHFSLIQIPF